MLTRVQLLQMNEDKVIRYILELSGYNDIINIVHENLEKILVSQ
jgi:hypothetical protein